MVMDPKQSDSGATHRNRRTSASIRITTPLPPDQLPQWFRIIFSAVEHEVGNSLFCFRILAKRTNDGAGLADIVMDRYQRMRAFGLVRQDSSLNDLKTILARLSGVPEANIDVQDRAEALEKVREAGIAAVHEFRSLLLEAWATFSIATIGQEESLLFHFNRATNYGAMLADVLEKILNGNLDFSAGIVEQRVFGEHSIKDTCIRCASNIRCTCSFAEPDEDMLDVGVASNPFFLQLIIANILANAKRASEESGSIPNVSVLVSRTAAGTVVMAFTDCGCGMPAETVEKLNSGISVSTKPDDGGTHGIGFFYCRELAARMGGQLYVSASSEGKGTTVVLELVEALEK